MGIREGDSKAAEAMSEALARLPELPSLDLLELELPDPERLLPIACAPGRVG